MDWPIVRLKIYVLWDEYRKLDWEVSKVIAVGFGLWKLVEIKRGPELTWERKDQMRSRELKRNGNVMVVNCRGVETIAGVEGGGLVQMVTCCGKVCIAWQMGLTKSPTLAMLRKVWENLEEWNAGYRLYGHITGGCDVTFELLAGRLWVVEGLSWRGVVRLEKKLTMKVRWDSKRGPELTWERKDQMRSRELKRNGNVMVVNCWNSNDQLEWVLWYASWLSDQLEWICGMLHGLVINWSSSAIETSRNRVNVGPRASALAGCDRLVSEPLVIEKTSCTCKPYPEALNYKIALLFLKGIARDVWSRPFLRTARVLIDVHGEELVIRDGMERIVFKPDGSQDKESIHMMDIYDDRFKDVYEPENNDSSSPTSTIDEEFDSLVGEIIKQKEEVKEISDPVARRRILYGEGIEKNEDSDTDKTKDFDKSNSNVFKSLSDELEPGVSSYVEGNNLDFHISDALFSTIIEDKVFNPGICDNVLTRKSSLILDVFDPLHPPLMDFHVTKALFGFTVSLMKLFSKKF
ncbi:hypothetical protein Tco_1361117 [Tanacetum coccineum]